MCILSLVVSIAFGHYSLAIKIKIVVTGSIYSVNIIAFQHNVVTGSICSLKIAVIVAFQHSSGIFPRAPCGLHLESPWEHSQKTINTLINMEGQHQHREQPGHCWHNVPYFMCIGVPRVSSLACI
jgi:hypothetical protein